MKRFDRMTLKELQSFHVIAKVEMSNKGGQVFPAGTRFEIKNKRGYLEIREIGAPANRSIRVRSWWQLEFVPANNACNRPASAVGMQSESLESAGG